MAYQDNTDLLLGEFPCYRPSEPIAFKTSRDTEERLNVIVSHLHKQHQEYINASKKTSEAFEELLDELVNITGYLKETISDRQMPSRQVFCEIDADRSVGILNILWHSVSFTTRGNTKPQALARNNGPPLFTGRIIALNGDFQDAALDLQDQEYPDILRCEIASLYIPHDPSMQAIVKIKHLSDQEFYFDQDVAPRQFLLKAIEIICGGGIYHEQDPDLDEE